MEDLGTLGGNSWGHAINDAGQVTGWSSIADDEEHAFRATPGQPMEDLGTLGGSHSWGYPINDAAQVAGCSDGVGAVRWTPISLLFSRLLDGVTGVGPGKSLAQKVRIATAYYDANDGPATCAMLRAFGNEEKAQSGKKKLSRDLAQQLMNDARTIRVAIGCKGGGPSAGADIHSFTPAPRRGVCLWALPSSTQLDLDPIFFQSM